MPLDAPPPQQVSGEWYRVDGLSDLGVHVHIDRGDERAPVVTQVQLTAGTVLAEHLRKVPLGEIERLLRYDTSVVGIGPSGEAALVPPPPVSRRLSGEDDVAFYHRVARSYRYHAGRTSAPSRAIAEESGVPVGTVRRWIKEARTARAIGPGRRGRAG